MSGTDWDFLSLLPWLFVVVVVALLLFPIFSLLYYLFSYNNYNTLSLTKWIIRAKWSHKLTVANCYYINGIVRVKTRLRVRQHTRVDRRQDLMSKVKLKTQQHKLAFKVHFNRIYKKFILHCILYMLTLNRTKSTKSSFC